MAYCVIKIALEKNALRRKEGAGALEGFLFHLLMWRSWQEKGARTVFPKKAMLQVAPKIQGRESSLADRLTSMTYQTRVAHGECSQK